VFFYFGVLEFLERVDEKREKKKYNAAKL